MPFDGVTTPEPTLAQQMVAARMRYARKQIAAGKWCQRTTDDDYGNRCLVGWLQWKPGDPIADPAVSHVWAALPQGARIRGGYCAVNDLARYNDTHTRNTIVRLLNRAIVAMETT